MILSTRDKDGLLLLLLLLVLIVVAVVDSNNNDDNEEPRLLLHDDDDDDDDDEDDEEPRLLVPLDDKGNDDDKRRGEMDVRPGLADMSPWIKGTSSCRTMDSSFRFSLDDENHEPTSLGTSMPSASMSIMVKARGVQCRSISIATGNWYRSLERRTKDGITVAT